MDHRANLYIITFLPFYVVYIGFFCSWKWFSVVSCNVQDDHYGWYIAVC